MDQVAGIHALSVIALLGPVAEPELGTTLLVESETRRRLEGPVTDPELVRVREGLDRATQLLRTTQVEVLDVVGVLWVGLGARGRVRHGDEPIPRNACTVDTAGGCGEEDAAVNASLKLALARPIPGQNSHCCLPPSEVEIVNVVDEILRNELSLEVAQHKVGQLVGQIIIGVSVNRCDFILSLLVVDLIVCMKSVIVIEIVDNGRIGHLEILGRLEVDMVTPQQLLQNPLKTQA